LTALTGFRTRTRRPRPARPVQVEVAIRPRRRNPAIEIKSGGTAKGGRADYRPGRRRTTSRGVAGAHLRRPAQHLTTLH